MGLSEGDEMTDGPGHDVSVTVLIAVSALVSANDFGNVPGDGGLFGDDCNSPGWLCVH